MTGTERPPIPSGACVVYKGWYLLMSDTNPNDVMSPLIETTLYARREGEEHWWPASVASFHDAKLRIDDTGEPW